MSVACWIISAAAKDIQRGCGLIRFLAVETDIASKSCDKLCGGNSNLKYARHDQAGGTLTLGLLSSQERFMCAQAKELICFPDHVLQTLCNTLACQLILTSTAH